jgi:predicted nuclease with TOPRIM domain
MHLEQSAIVAGALGIFNIIQAFVLKRADAALQDAKRRQEEERQRGEQLWDENKALRDGLWKEVERLQAEVIECRQEASRWREEALKAQAQVTDLQQQVTRLQARLDTYSPHSPEGVSA